MGGTFRFPGNTERCKTAPASPSSLLAKPSVAKPEIAVTCSVENWVANERARIIHTVGTSKHHKKLNPNYITYLKTCSRPQQETNLPKPYLWGARLVLFMESKVVNWRVNLTQKTCKMSQAQPHPPDTSNRQSLFLQRFVAPPSAQWLQDRLPGRD